MKIKNSYFEFACIALGSLFCVFGILLISGTITSGYHLADDHEIVLLTQRFNEGLYDWKVLFRKGIFDYFAEGIRFRPFYESIRFLRVFLFGTNYVAWSIWVALECVFSIVLAYYISRNLGGDKLVSFLIGILIISGEQSEIWWRLGPQEPTGLLLCLLCLLLIQIYEISGKKRICIPVILSAFLMAATKESFTIILPAIGLFGVGYDLFITQFDNLWMGIKKTFRKNLLIFLSFSIIFIVNLYIIVFRVGLMSIGYAGLDVELGISGYLSLIVDILCSRGMRVFVIILIVSLFLYIIGNKKKLPKGKKRAIYIIAFSFLFIIGIELVLYAKSGMRGRYFVPFVIGVYFISITLISSIISSKKIRCVHTAIIMLCLVYALKVVWINACSFTEQGKVLNNGLSELDEYVDKESVVLTCIDRSEYDYSISIYGKIELGLKNIYALNVDNQICSLYKENEQIINDVTDADYLILSHDTDMVEHIDLTKYTICIDLGYGYVYQKN